MSRTDFVIYRTYKCYYCYESSGNRKTSKNFPGGIIKVPKVSWSDAFHTLVWLDFGGKMPKHFSGKSGKWEQTTKGRLTSQILWKSQTINLHQRTKKIYGHRCSQPQKATSRSARSDQVSRYYRKCLGRQGQHQIYCTDVRSRENKRLSDCEHATSQIQKNMTWDNFLIFVMDKWLKPYHQQDIEAIKSKVDIISMEEDEEQPRSGAKNKGVSQVLLLSTHM